jgi:hypothetical protein
MYDKWKTRIAVALIYLAGGLGLILTIMIIADLARSTNG